MGRKPPVMSVSTSKAALKKDPQSWGRKHSGCFLYHVVIQLKKDPQSWGRKPHAAQESIKFVKYSLKKDPQSWGRKHSEFLNHFGRMFQIKKRSPIMGTKTERW